MKTSLTLIITWLFFISAKAQSVEIMPGNNFVFTDIQFFKPLDNKYRTTLFSRTRARLTYDDDENGVNFFSGAYLNYTTKVGLGGTLIGRMNNLGSDMDFGIHFYKKIKNFSVYALPAVSLSQKDTYSWFSIVKYRPAISEKWKLYTSLELFSILHKLDHVISTQRIRLGLDFQTYQFGAAINISEFGMDWEVVNDNFGVFLRKEF